MEPIKSCFTCSHFLFLTGSRNPPRVDCMKNQFSETRVEDFGYGGQVLSTMLGAKGCKHYSPLKTNQNIVEKLFQNKLNRGKTDALTEKTETASTQTETKKTPGTTNNLPATPASPPDVLGSNFGTTDGLTDHGVTSKHRPGSYKPL